MEAIKTELIRDQEEIQEIQQRLIALQERTRANRAWLKAYGFGEHVSSTPAPLALQSDTIAEILENDANIGVPAVDLQETVVTEPLEVPAAALTPVEAEPSPQVLVEVQPSNLKAEGRKKLYDALISRGARINS
jgi:hypothetical protein